MPNLALYWRLKLKLSVRPLGKAFLRKESAVNLVIVTGMSGAGKSTVLKFLEDIGFYCADNIPPSLIAAFAEEVLGREGRGQDGITRLAIGVDIRGGRLFDGFFEGLAKLRFGYKILFLDALDDVLIKRYKETRRSHPLAPHERTAAGIERERNLLYEIRSNSDYIIDTTYTLTRQLKEKIREIFVDARSFDSLIITVLSFGYKYGIPTDSDLIFDVRFIPNPFYDTSLRHLTGKDEPVRDFVMKAQQTQRFLSQLKEMLEFLIPCYVTEGKNLLVVSIGCTGGKHRSVAIANSIVDELLQKGNSVIINHRDIEKDKY